MTTIEERAVELHTRLMAVRDNHAARGVLYNRAVTIEIMIELCRAHEWWGWSTGWKRSRFEAHVIAHAERARLDAALKAGDEETLWTAYERARVDAARADGRPPAREDMRPRVEAFRGRKLRAEKGREWGTIVLKVNGQHAFTEHGSSPADLDRAAASARDWVIAADEKRITDPDAYPAHYYEGAPAPHPAVMAYMRYVDARDRADRAAIFDQAPASDAPAPGPAVYVSGWSALLND
jgi:hypothetical protein